MELYLVEFRVSDWAQSVSWYRDMLDLKVLLVDEEHQYSLLEAGPGRIALKTSVVGQDRSAMRITFRVDDIEEVRARLVDLGVEVSSTITNANEGFSEVRLIDPDGTPITIFAWTRL